MSKLTISKEVQEELKKFLARTKNADLLTTYLFYLEKKNRFHPVLFIREKMIFQSESDLLKKLEKEGKVWRETEIKIQVGNPVVNEETQKIYICPFTGKVFGDNTHPNPQDAIYDWVSKCPENTERKDGIRVKRFFVSEDPDMIKNYIKKQKEPISKIVYSSAATGKLFNSKEAVIEDFKQNQLKPLSLVDVANQNRFSLETSLLNFIQENLDESRVSEFVDAMSHIKDFADHVEQWTAEEEESVES